MFLNPARGRAPHILLILPSFSARGGKIESCGGSPLKYLRVGASEHGRVHKARGVHVAKRLVPEGKEGGEGDELWNRATHRKRAEGG